MKKYAVRGMSCAACSARVEKAVSAVEGVEECRVNLLTASMTVAGDVSPECVVAAVERAGYGASVWDASCSVDALVDRETPKLLRRLLFSLGFLLLLMYFSMGYTMWHFPLPALLTQAPVWIAAIQLALSSAVLVINHKFFVNGVKGVLRASPNMDTLVALGSGISYGYSVYLFITMFFASNPHGVLHTLYFEAAAMIPALITLGKMLEARAKGKTTSAIRGLMSLTPPTAKLWREGREVTVPVDDVRVGDVFLLYPGDSVPVDGTVLEGESAIDESALTGESVPRDKAVGDGVFAATVNRSGFLRCRAEKVGEDTTLFGIVRMVSEASATKAPIAKAADRVAGIFVPVVLGIAAVTLAVWLIVTGGDVGHAIARAISVLVISCPCALGLATPVAIMVGTGVGAKNGILFKTAEALEQVGRVKTVVLDKTGTLTHGTPQVTDVLPFSGDETALLTVAYSLEKQSEHPLGRAVVQYCEEKGLCAFETEGFAALPGNGISAKTKEGVPLLAGNISFLSKTCKIPEEVLSSLEAAAEEGKTPLLFAKGEELLGAVLVADTLREDSVAAVRTMRSMGLSVVMLTGDHPRTAMAVGRLAGVDAVVGGVLPSGKAEKIRALQKKGPVMMVGDGINDAPALTQADVGLAIGAGTDIAMDAADVVLTQSTLTQAVAAIRLGRATLRNIRQNLFWAFCYNCIGIPLAAGAFVPLLGWEMDPMFGALAMSLSSASVVLNALRLNFFRPWRVGEGKKSKAAEAALLTDDTLDEIKETEKEENAMDATVTIHVEGMMCPHCEARVKKCLEELPQVAEAKVSHEQGTAVVTLCGELSEDALKAVIAAQGYGVK